MDKSELIDVLRETGIVSKENYANGVRVLLTLNDFETLKSKTNQSILDKKLKKVQFWGIIITALCLIATTFWGILSKNTNSIQYIPRNHYILKLTDGGKEKCLIPEVPANRVYTLERVTGIKSCY